jgi:hypothetical protein
MHFTHLVHCCLTCYTGKTQSCRDYKAVASHGPDDSFGSLSPASTFRFHCSDFPFSLLSSSFHIISATYLALLYNLYINIHFPSPAGIGPSLYYLNLRQAPSVCATSSSRNTRSAGASTTSTASTCVPHMANKGMEYKSEQFWSVTPATNTQRVRRHTTPNMATRIRAMEQQATRRIGSLHVATTAGDETCCPP